MGLKRDSGHPILSCFELKERKQQYEAIPSLKQFAPMESIGCRKHWSSWKMLKNYSGPILRVFRLPLTLL